MKTKSSLLFLAFSIIVSVSHCLGQTETTLHIFTGYSKDGGVGQGGVFGGFVADKAGNLYGTTPYGGSSSFCVQQGQLTGCGTVFQLVPPQQAGGLWTQNIIYSFLPHNTGDGYQPTGGLAIDANGNLYGTTRDGQGSYNAGTAFELSPPAQKGGAWTEKVIYAFGSEGHNPNGSLIIDSAGNLYGTTNEGGDHQAGLAFELSPPSGGQQTWTETALYSFGKNNNDGSYPLSGLVMDKEGNFYGTTTMGGGNNWGTVFQLVPGKAGGPWTENVAYRFNGSTDGGNPEGGLLIHNGALYGTSLIGNGNVFEISLKGSQVVERVLYTFQDGSDGSAPQTALIADATGNLYGTTYAGGGGYGVVYQLSHNLTGWHETTLYAFTGGADGAFPVTPLFLENGSLLGMTSLGGDDKCYADLVNGCGTTFEVAP